MKKLTAIAAITILGAICLLISGANIAFETALSVPTPGPSQIALTQQAAQQTGIIEITKNSGNATMVAAILSNLSSEATAQANAQANESTAQAAESTAGAIRAAQTTEAFNIFSQTQSAQILMTAEASRAASMATAAVEQTERAQAYQRELWTATAYADQAAATRAAQIAQTTAQAASTATAESNRLWTFGLTVTADVARSTATARVQATTDAFIAANLERAQERQKLVNALVAFSPYAIGALTLALLIWITLLLVPVVQERMRDRAPDKSGRYPMIVTQNGMIFLADRSPSSLVNVNAHNPGAVIDFDPSLIERVTARAQALEIARAALPGQSPRVSVDPGPAAQATTLPAVSPLPDIAPWSILHSWPGGKIALGISENGPITVDPEGNAPHLLFAGATGSGKTRYGLRPVIAETLADGWQVIIISRGGPDLAVFEKHPNAPIVEIEEPAQAVALMQRAYRELLRRLRLLTNSQSSTWSRSNSDDPRTLIVIDEFSNLADDAASPAERENLWRAARMLAAEGRKTGIILAIALQDPSHKSMDLRIRRNATKIAFRVQDEHASRIILGAGGAEHLPRHRFMVVTDHLVIGSAFDPTDQDINNFLKVRQVPMLPAPAWIEEIEDQQPDDPQQSQPDRSQRIKELLASGLSANEVQRRVFGFTGGAAYAAVRAVLLASTTSTTTTRT